MYGWRYRFAQLRREQHRVRAALIKEVWWALLLDVASQTSVSAPYDRNHEVGNVFGFDQLASRESLPWWQHIFVAIPNVALQEVDWCGSLVLRAETWLILPVVICWALRLSHACPSMSFNTTTLRMAH